MAKTFETYERLRDENAATHRKLEERIEGAVELTELLQDVRRRVGAFVIAYEKMFAPEVDHVKYTREQETYDPESRAARVADNMEMDLQTLRPAPAQPDNARLLLDDLKILLDKFPQQVF